MRNRPRVVRVDQMHAERPPIEFSSNEELIELWHRHAVGLSPRTRTKYYEQINRMAEAFSNLMIHKLTALELRDYLDQYTSVCRFYKDWGLSGDLECRAGRDMDRCPVLKEGEVCPSYEPKSKGTTGKHLDALCHLWRWMQSRGLVTVNVAREIRDQWRAETRHLPRTLGEQRLLSPEEVKRLVEVARKPNHRIFIIVLLKSGARIEEVQRLKVDEAHYNPEERWLKIPRRKGSKRDLANDGKANHYIGIDLEFKRWLDSYLKWREKTMAYYGVEHDSLLVNHFGKPMEGFSSYKTLAHRWLKPLLIEAEINKPWDQGPDRVKPHSLRHYATTVWRSNGADPGWVEVMRGCTPPGSQAIYHHVTPKMVVKAFDEWGVRILAANI